MIRPILGVAAALCLGLDAASAEPKTVSLWHVFTLETDMIYGGIKAFNESQTRIPHRCRASCPARRSSTELIKAIATGSVPDLVTLDNPVVASFSAQGIAHRPRPTASPSRSSSSPTLLQGTVGVRAVEGQDLRGAARRQHAGALLQCRHVPGQGSRPRQAAEDLVRAGRRRREAARSRPRTSSASASAPSGRGRHVPVAALPASGRRLDRQARRSPRPPRRCELWADMVKNGMASRDVINQRQDEVTNTFMAGNTAMALAVRGSCRACRTRRSSTGGSRCCR